MTIPRIIGRAMFAAMYAVAAALRRHGRVVAARRIISWWWRTGLRGWADRVSRGEARDEERWR